MKVSLLNYSPYDKRTVVAAAKGCYSSLSSIDIDNKDYSEYEATKFLRGLISSGHDSVLEHAYYTFSIEGISRACSHQLVRHRIASYSQQSQRYVKFANAKHPEDFFVIPPEIEKNRTLRSGFLDVTVLAYNAYFDLVEALEDSGRTTEQAQEDARYVLPNAAKTNITVTMNIRELRHFFNQRMCKRSQWEIRELAFNMYRLVFAYSPELLWNSGANCMFGSCKEGKHTCGDPYPQSSGILFEESKSKVTETYGKALEELGKE